MIEQAGEVRKEAWCRFGIVIELWVVRDRQWSKIVDVDDVVVGCKDSVTWSGGGRCSSLSKVGLR